MEQLRYFFHLDGQKIIELFQYNRRDPLLFGSAFFLMLFIGILFVLFLMKGKPKFRLWFLIIFSIFFYYKASGLLLVVLPISALVNYILGKGLVAAKNEILKKIVLVAAIFLNIGALAYFKYTNFFLQIAAEIQHHEFQALDIIVPLGISFYTFKALSYIFDIYYEFLEEQHTFADFFLYLSYFPNILAGPIDRASKFIPQIKEWNPLTKEDIGRALTLIVLGLIKKFVIADYIGLNFVDRVFDEGSPLRFTGVENLLAMYAYTLQIFCDFSGYTDVAIGVSLLMGFRLMENFNYPYKARSVADFWRRWHISLSSWLSDYLFKPLQMSVRSLRVFGNAIAIFVTFLICGLWHGASWNFVIWGAMHAIFMSFAILIKGTKDKLYKSLGLDKSKVWAVVQVIFTFHLIAASWVFFRTASLTTAKEVFSQIFLFFNAGVFPQFIKAYPQIVGMLTVGYLFHFLPQSLFGRTEKVMTKIPLPGQALLLALVIWVVSQFRFADIVPFIYFQF
jgi:D-alanyl-lipoteichoic acid acyltransferase DltB (MBOAT superfamily)